MTRGSPLRRSKAASAERYDERADLSWYSIAEGIRIHAGQQPPEVASDLLQWADFLEGIAELERRLG